MKGFTTLICWMVFNKSLALKLPFIIHNSEIGYLLYSVFFFLNKFIYLFIYFWVCWVFVSVQGLSLVAESGGHSSSQCAGLSPSWPLLLRSTGSRRTGSVVVAHGLSCSAACGIFPDQGSNPCPLHWQADSQPLRHQGSPMVLLFIGISVGKHSDFTTIVPCQWQHEVTSPCLYWVDFYFLFSCQHGRSVQWKVCHFNMTPSTASHQSTDAKKQNTGPDLGDLTVWLDDYLMILK